MVLFYVISFTWCGSHNFRSIQIWSPQPSKIINRSTSKITNISHISHIFQKKIIHGQLQSFWSLIHAFILSKATIHPGLRCLTFSACSGTDHLTDLDAFIRSEEVRHFTGVPGRRRVAERCLVVFCQQNSWGLWWFIWEIFSNERKAI